MRYSVSPFLFILSGSFGFSVLTTVQHVTLGHALQPKTYIIPFALGGLLGCIVSIWYRQNSQINAKLSHLNLVLKTIRNINQLLIQEKNRDRLIQGVCDYLVEYRGFFNAWIALMDDRGGWESIAESGSSNAFEQILSRLKKGCLVACCQKALSQPGIIVTDEPTTLCTDCPRVDSYENNSVVSCQLAYNGNVYGVMTLCIAKELVFEEEEQKLIEEIARDIAFGLYNFELRIKREESEKALRNNMDALHERVKELNCFFGLSSLIEKQKISLEEIFQGVVELIPPAWRYTDITCAKIKIDQQEFKTDNYQETAWQLSKDIIVNHKAIGCITAGYLEERPDSDQGPFLREEKSLIDAIAERLGRVIEHRYSHEKLKENESRFRELFRHMKSGVAIYEAVNNGKDFLIKDINQAGENIDCINKEAIIGKSVLEVYPAIKESGLFGAMERVWETGKPEKLPAGFYRDERINGWRENHLYQLPPGEIVVVYSDVTKQKEAEDELRASKKRFRTLIENSHAGISIVQENEVVYQNEEQERLLGPLPRSNILGDYANIHSDDIDKVKKLIHDITSGKIQALDIDFRYSQAGDPNMPIWIYCRAHVIDYQQKKSILVNMMDMTQMKKLEDLLRIQDKMASLGRVTAGIAHEIRNPLSGINIYTNTLQKYMRRGEGEEKIKNVLQHMQSASRKIESIIRRVMDFSKPGAPIFIAADIGKSVEEAIDLSAVTLRKSGIKLEKSLAGNLPKCHLDHTQIEEVILNLINNAVDAMRRSPGQKKIMVITSSDDECVTVRVLDSGPGLKNEYKNKVFDPFFTTKSDSTGIGLSICHRIIVDHGGSIGVHKSHWGGAEFHFTIPVAA